MSGTRLFQIVYELLEKGHTTAPALADKLEVSTRTIYRDIEALSSAGIPVCAETGRNGGVFLLQDFVLDRAVLSEHERQEILTGMQSIFAAGYPNGDELFTKLSALFHMDSESWIEVDFSRWGKSACDNEKFEKLKRALMEHKEIRILYENTRSERTARIVQPIKLSYQSKEWYLKAFCLAKQDFRLFKLNRMLELEVLEQTFEPKPYPDQEQNWQQPYPCIVLLFAGELAYRVYDEFDESQITRQKNGDLIVCACMPVDAWLVGYVLSFGAQVEIREPAYLKEMVAAQAWEIYQKNRKP
ncbi:MAG: YafY family transcriptional regulator [Eubacterium sp.]|nr:YafY family transcriptional regulator [Eubacterium sp.]